MFLHRLLGPRSAGRPWSCVAQEGGPRSHLCRGLSLGALLHGRWREFAAVPCLRASSQSGWDGGKLSNG